MLHSKNNGKNINRRIAGIQMFLAVNTGGIAPAVIRPKKSNKLKSRKKKGTYKSLEKRSDVLHLFMDSSSTITDGKRPIVTAKTRKTEKEGINISW
mmetsp:Transcript_15566/g.26055  ORF Transcript_15566/g.26055 Transcript_15566/m.26055 type:complete len:96 (-) Transcript_15566:1561-1848(-)